MCLSVLDMVRFSPVLIPKQSSTTVMGTAFTSKAKILASVVKLQLPALADPMF